MGNGSSCINLTKTDDDYVTLRMIINMKDINTFIEYFNKYNSKNLSNYCKTDPIICNYVILHLNDLTSIITKDIFDNLFEIWLSQLNTQISNRIKNNTHYSNFKESKYFSIVHKNKLEKKFKEIFMKMWLSHIQSFYDIRYHEFHLYGDKILQYYINGIKNLTNQHVISNVSENIHMLNSDVQNIVSYIVINILDFYNKKELFNNNIDLFLLTMPIETNYSPIYYNSVRKLITIDAIYAKNILDQTIFHEPYIRIIPNDIICSLIKDPAFDYSVLKIKSKNNKFGFEALNHDLIDKIIYNKIKNELHIKNVDYDKL